MKKNKIIFDMFIAILGIVLILGTARGINLSKKTNETKSKELSVASSAPSQLKLTTRKFLEQDDNRLVLPHSTGYSVNQQFDYTVAGAANNTITYFPVLYVAEGEQQDEVVYCLDVTKDVPDKANEYLPSKASAALSYLASTGGLAKQTQLTVNTELDYFATQVAIYSILNQTSKDSTYENLNSQYAQSMGTKINDLVAAAQNATFDIVLTATGNKELNKVSGQNYYESELITVSSTQIDPQITLSTNNNNVTILDSNNNEITSAVANGTQFKIRVPESALADGANNIVIDADINAKINQAYKYETTATSNNQPILYAQTFEEPVSDSDTINFTANKAAVTYSIKILKVDGTHNPLADAQLVVRKNGVTDPIKSFTSTTTGITINNLSPGDYTIEEIVTPTGYKKAANVTFSIPEDNAKTIEVVNEEAPEEKGNITVNKVDESGNGLAGALIILKNSTGREVGRFTTTDGNTSHTFDNLPIGTYTIIEADAPVGYRKSDNILVNVENGQTATKNVVNKKTSVTIIKHNESNQALAGAELEVVNSSGKVVYSWTTDATGSHTIEGIPVGSYKLREKSAPTGYTKSDKEVAFTIQHEGPTDDIVFNNYKNIVKILKIDEDTDKLIGGANLVVKDSEGNNVKSFMTDGTVYELNGLEAGTYTIEETQAPSGYAKLTDKITFTVAADSTEVIVKVPNAKLVTVPSTSTSASTFLFMLGFLFITCGGAFIYYYVKTPQNL